MSVQTEITRLLTARNTIRNKLVNLGLAESTDELDDLATEINSIENRGAVSASVQEGETYTIPAGYHNGTGTVQGVAGGGNYTLQTKTITPTKAQQSVAPDQGYYGLSGVTVNAIPEAYQDVSSVDAAAADVLANKKFVTSAGVLTPGTMVNNGAVTQVLNAGGSYTIPQGYHNGEGTVSVNPNLVDTSDADAVAANITDGKTAYVNGVKVTGTMVNNGAISASIDGLTTTSYTVPAGYTSGGTVSLTNDIETALAGI